VKVAGEGQGTGLAEEGAGRGGAGAEGLAVVELARGNIDDDALLLNAALLQRGTLLGKATGGGGGSISDFMALGGSGDVTSAKGRGGAGGALGGARGAVRGRDSVSGSVTLGHGGLRPLGGAGMTLRRGTVNFTLFEALGGSRCPSKVCKTLGRSSSGSSRSNFVDGPWGCTTLAELVGESE